MRVDILGTGIDLLNLEKSMQFISKALAEGRKLWIVSANPELIFRAEKDKKLQRIINKADLVLPDGIGLVWAVRQLAGKNTERVTGVDLTWRILEEGNKNAWRIFLLGSKQGVAEKAVCELRNKYPEIVFDSHHGYFSEAEEPEVLEKIEKLAPHILLVGIGAPRQENWNASYKGNAGVRIGVGGTLDVLSGEVRRAPKFYCDHNLEWLYRLIKEPSRLRRQYILPLYVLRVLRKKYKGRP